MNMSKETINKILKRYDGAKYAEGFSSVESKLLLQIAKEVCLKVMESIPEDVPARELVKAKIESLDNEIDSVSEFWKTLMDIRESVTSVDKTMEEKQLLLRWYNMADGVDKLLQKWSRTDNEKISEGLYLILDAAKDDQVEAIKKIIESHLVAAWEKINEKKKSLEYFYKTFPKTSAKLSDNFREDEGVISFYVREDKYRDIPSLMLFPGLSDEEIGKIENAMGVSLPSEYKEFLRHHNGLGTKNGFFFWGVRRSYDVSKYQEQYFSLMSSGVPKDVAAIISKSEVVMASDRDNNRFTMEMVGGGVFGYVKKDELATAERISFESLDDLLVKNYE